MTMTMHPNIVLLKKYVSIKSQTRVLCAGLDDVTYLEEVAQKVQEVAVYHHDGRVIEQLKRQLSQYDHVQVHASVFPDQIDYFDLALVGIPKGRDVTRAVLSTCLRGLKIGGVGFVVGANKGGIKTALTDMQTCTRALSLGTKQRHRVFSMSKTAETNLSDEWLAYAQPRPMTIEFSGVTYTVHTQPGVFSHAHLDEGTRLLLESLGELEIPAEQSFLDAGCGYGIVGLYVEKKFSPSKVVWADVDLLALNCVQSLKPKARVAYADLTQDKLPEDTPFDWIICNPPFHQQHAVDTSFMENFGRNAGNLLTTKGQVMLVYNAFLPYEQLLKQSFREQVVLRENNQFKVVLAKR